MIPSGYQDTFARDHLPPSDQWPDMLLDRPEFAYPDRINCVSRLLDSWMDRQWERQPCFYSASGAWSYGDTARQVNRIANVLVNQMGMRTGERVLLRAPNTPMLAAAWLAVLKAGGIAVMTMPLLRAAELGPIIERAQCRLALCDHRLCEELELACASTAGVEQRMVFGADDAGLELAMQRESEEFAACDTASDDVCMLAFTSGTTGGSKATMHFHRDVLAIADSYGRAVVRASATDRFIGSPPLAFTFGLGGLVIFPMAVGASSILVERPTADAMLGAIQEYRATIMFTAPTAYRSMVPLVGDYDISSLRACVSAGETLPATTFHAWQSATGVALMDGIGATEMLHVFIGSPRDHVKAGATGQVVPGYEARVVDDDGHELPRGTPGHLIVRGPTGCRYLDDARQTRYVRNGWNWTGDTFVHGSDGYFWYQARADDMIISSGYNIAGPEVEHALLTHAAVAECAVVAGHDDERGAIVVAFVVAREGTEVGDVLAKSLQDHVKATIAPYKYPRRIVFVPALPKSATGKVQRHRLREALASARSLDA